MGVSLRCLSQFGEYNLESIFSVCRLRGCPCVLRLSNWTQRERLPCGQRFFSTNGSGPIDKEISIPFCRQACIIGHWDPLGFGPSLVNLRPIGFPTE